MNTIRNCAEHTAYGLTTAQVTGLRERIAHWHRDLTGTRYGDPASDTAD